MEFDLIISASTSVKDIRPIEMISAWGCCWTNSFQVLDSRVVFLVRINCTPACAARSKKCEKFESKLVEPTLSIQTTRGALRSKCSWMLLTTISKSWMTGSRLNGVSICLELRLTLISTACIVNVLLVDAFGRIAIRPWKSSVPRRICRMMFAQASLVLEVAWTSMNTPC